MNVDNMTLDRCWYLHRVPTEELIIRRRLQALKQELKVSKQSACIWNMRLAYADFMGFGCDKYAKQLERELQFIKLIKNKIKETKACLPQKRLVP